MTGQIATAVAFFCHVLFLGFDTIGVRAFASAIKASSGASWNCATCGKDRNALAMLVEKSLSDDFRVDNDTDEFHQCAASAVDISSCHVSSESILSVTRSVRNWELENRQKYLYRMDLKPLLAETGVSETTEKVMMFPPVHLDSSVDLYLPSPSGKKTALIKKEEKNGTTEIIVEIWQGDCLTRRIQVGTNGIHGKIINDPDGFGTPSWSPDENFLLYSAERPAPTTSAFWKKTKAPTDDNDISSRNEKDQRGGRNVLGQGSSESWGECYPDQEATMDLYILNVSTGRFGRVENVPNDFEEGSRNLPSSSASSVTLGQAVWHPNSSKIAFTGWATNQPKRLGMVYCKNRASKIYETDVRMLLQSLSGERKQMEENHGIKHDTCYRCMSGNLVFSRSPRYVGDSLVFLASEHAFASHDACMGLYGWNEIEQRSVVIVPLTQIPSTSGPQVFGVGFPGLYLGQLPMKCSIDEKFLFTTIQWGSVRRIVRVNIVSGDVDLIDSPQLNQMGSHSLCTIGPNGDLIISETSYEKPANLWIVEKRWLLDDSTTENRRVVVDAKRATNFSPLAASTFSAVRPTSDTSFDTHIISTMSNEIDGAPARPVQSVLLLPKSKEEKVALVVVPHGGPHGCSTLGFNPGIAYLASKYAVLLPNYRGSTGFGQASLDSLLTRIGKVDVDDVMECTAHAIDNFPVIDGDRIGICGGSHGGFLTAHCTSQFPEFFKAAAMRNPVTNIASMVTSTDIPDWCYGEVMGKYDQSRFRGPTSDQIVEMHEKSPVARVHQVKCPTLIAVGLVDLRVPPSQGLEWFHSLRSLEVPTKLLKYPQDCHSLNNVGTEADHWMHIRHWFDVYL